MLRAVAVMIETATGVARAMDRGGAPAVCMAIVGSADLHVSLRARPDPGRIWELHALSRVLLAARRYGHLAIDSVYFRYRDDEGSGPCRHRENARLRRQELHPPGTGRRGPRRLQEHTGGASPGRGAFSRRGPRARGAGGVVAMDGEMIESLHVTLAERILEGE
jgi:citrate lyase subunit beta/citryl-CoA lyase